MKKIRSLVNNSSWVIAVIYLIAGFIWILYSDQWVLYILSDPEQITRVQSQKGWFFVAVSAFIIFLLIKQNNNMLGRSIENLAINNKKFEATFNNSPVGIAYHKPNEKWIEVNQTLCDLLGYTKKEFMQLHFSDFIDSDDLHHGRDLDRQLAEGKIDYIEVEKKYIRKDGSKFPGVLRKSAVFNGQNSAEYLIAVVEDVSRQKKHEEQLNKSLMEKEVLLSEVHHRVKNNLAIISALFDFQTMYTEDEQVQSIMDKSRIRIKCLAMIHETFSQNGDSVEINFSSFLNQLVSFLKSAFSFQKQNVLIKSDIKPVQLNINLAIPLSLIFTELMIHAKSDKIEGDKKPVIIVTLIEKGNLVTLTVKDEGAGLFKKKEVDTPNTLTFTIVKTLVDQIQGDFDARFNKNKASFTLTLEKKNVRGVGSHAH